MDERLLKKSVESIEMPLDMKDRIISSCRSGETKPLILPKKRFAYMPTAVTACLCVLVAALTGVGVWQLKTLSEKPPVFTLDTVLADPQENTTGEPPATVTSDNGTVEPQEDVINVLEITWDDINKGMNKFRPDEFKDSDRVELTYDELMEYFGMDVTNFANIPLDMGEYKTQVDPDGVIYRSGGTGEVYYDTNGAFYGDPDGIRWVSIKVSALWIPDSVEKLWSDSTTMVSSINGTPVAIGMVSDTEYGDHDYYVAEFKSEDGRLGFQVCGPVLLEEVCNIVSAITSPDSDQAVRQTLTIDKLLEICSGDTSKLSWDNFKQFECKEIGSGLYILQYNIEDKYTLLIGGVPEEEPYYMIFHAAGQYYDIDIREESIEEYLSQPIPEGDVIHVIPITWEDIDNSKRSDITDFTEGDQVPLTDEQLSKYYGIDITSFRGIPSDMAPYAYQGTPTVESRHIWYDAHSSVYYDQNAFYYASPDGSRSIMITVATLPDQIEKLQEDKKMRSVIGGRIVLIGQTEDGYYKAEILSADSVLGIGVSGMGVTLEELCDVIAALVEQTEQRDYIEEPYRYPWEYIVALQMQGNGKDNYQEDPAEFIFGIQKIIQNSDTVEEMYQALAEFDTEGRIDKVLLSFDGVPVADGDIRQGMYCEVYYDNETSWFDFSI